LTHIGPQHLGILPVPGCLERLVQREPGLSGQAELLEREVGQNLLGGAGVVGGFDLGEAVGKEEDGVDEQAVSRPVDLEVAEEYVGAEERERLVQDVVRFAVRVWGLRRWV